VSRTVTLYTRNNCGLCDEALAELSLLAPQLRFQIREIDIDQDGALLEQYDAIVPVIAVDGRVIAQAPMRPAELRAGLERALAGSA
jgi:glutaredoxin